MSTKRNQKVVLYEETHTESAVLFHNSFELKDVTVVQEIGFLYDLGPCYCRLLNYCLPVLYLISSYSKK